MDTIQEMNWRAMQVQGTALRCAECGTPITHCQNGASKEFWYFHGRSVALPSMVISEKEARMAGAGQGPSIATRVMRWTRAYHATIESREVHNLVQRLASGEFKP